MTIILFMRKILGLFVLMAFSVSFAETPVCGRIESMRGEVEVLRLSRPPEEIRIGLRATEKSDILCSDIVVTQKGGRALLRFKSGASMTMGPFSRLEVLDFMQDKSTGAIFRLTYGKLRALIKSDKKEQRTDNKPGFSRMLIKTPSAVVGVRGTDFYVGFEPQTFITDQATMQGEVEVEKLQTNERVLVKKGFQVSILGSDGLPEEQKSIVKSQPLKVEPIDAQVLNSIRQTSVIAKKESDFTTKDAVDILGPSEKWSAPPEDLPMDLKNMKEEF